MNTFKTMIIGLLILSATSCTLTKKSATVTRTLAQKVETKDFTFFIDRSVPDGIRPTTFRSDEILKLKNDNAFALMPFHGIVTGDPMKNDSEPIRFDGPMKGFTMTQDPVKGWKITFNIESNPYIYQVNIEITNKGKAVVKVTSNQRTTMTYFGEVD
jgi:hypothetical protein